MKRKPVAVSMCVDKDGLIGYVVIANDGTMWESWDLSAWSPIDDLPQPEEWETDE